MAITKNLELVRGSNGAGVGLKATITAPRTTGSTTFTVDNVGNINSSFIATSGTPDPDTGIIISNKLVWEGHVSGSTLVLDTVAPGYTDAGNSANDIVVIKPTSHWANVLVETLEAEHKTTGKHSDVTFDSLTANSGASVDFSNAPLGADSLDFSSFDIGGQLTIKISKVSDDGSGLAAWGSIYYKDITMPDWSEAFSSILAAIPFTTNKQYTVTGPDSFSTSSVGPVRLLKPTSGALSVDIYVVGIGLA